MKYERIQYQGIGYQVVKDPVALKYFRMLPEQFYLLIHLNGESSLEDLRREILKEFPTSQLPLSEIQQLIVDLHEKGLLDSDRPGHGETLLRRHQDTRRKKRIAGFKNILYFRMPGWDPEPTLRVIYPFVRWMFRSWAVTLTVLFVLASWMFLAVEFKTFREHLPEFQQFFGWPNLIYLWVTLSFAKVLHEFGHGLCCRHFDGECHEMGLMLLVFTPTLYCDASDSWILPNKWKRIAIGGAGMYVEILLSSIAIFLWMNTQSGLFNHLCLNLFFVTTVTTVLFNANPLMRFDGYYMLSDLLEIPNLRPKADQLLRDSFGWYCLGIEPRTNPFMPERGRFWFITFAIAAAAYRWVILFGITIFLYTVLKPYGLQSLGIGLAIFSMGMILFNGVSNVYKMMTAPREDPMSRTKIVSTLVMIAVVIAAISVIPLPLHLKASFTIEPDEVQHVYTTVDGTRTEVFVKPGQRVQKGEVLARLANPLKQDELHKLKVQERVLKKQVDVFDALSDFVQRKLAQRRLLSIREQIVDLEKQLQQLEVIAPCAGIVIAPPRVPQPSSDKDPLLLGTWFGTPLEPRNTNCYLDRQTHLLSIGPHDHYEAILIVDQADRNDLFTGQQVELKFDHLPDRIFSAQVSEISERHIEFAPSSLSNKYGGSIPTVTDLRGREKLTSISYQATVDLDRETEYLHPGLRGQARFLVESRTTFDWVWRYLQQTFRFRL